MIRLGTRKGKPPIGLDELARRMTGRAKKSDDPLWGAFVTAIKLAVSDEEALEAARALSEPPSSRARRYAQGAGVGAVASPAMEVAGNAAKALAGGKGVRGAAAAAKDSLRKTELARFVTKGVLGGGAVQAMRENVQLSSAKKTVEDYLKEHKS